jgi:hypothetical protein
LERTGREALAYKNKAKTAVQDRIELATHIGESVQPALFKMKSKGQWKRSTRKSKHEHSVVWHKNRFVCTTCGSFKKGHCRGWTKCHAVILRKERLGHTTLSDYTAMYQAENCGTEVMFAFCTRCACYSTTNIVGIKSVCKPKAGFPTQVRRLTQYQHPVTKR